ncbi:MAG: hypothetical protein EAX90_04635 [Candidatus Heimdallarchaeota archaeon]|nr:hypothetical protein [Candidatus Heimdallarchaeota archaeon]
MTKKDVKRITINKGNPRSNMAIVGNIRQVSSPIIGEINEPVILETNSEKKKTRLVKKKRD